MYLLKLKNDGNTLIILWINSGWEVGFDSKGDKSDMRQSNQQSRRLHLVGSEIVEESIRGKKTSKPNRRELKLIVKILWTSHMQKIGADIT